MTIPMRYKGWAKGKSNNFGLSVIDLPEQTSEERQCDALREIHGLPWFNETKKINLINAIRGKKKKTFQTMRMNWKGFLTRPTTGN